MGIDGILTNRVAIITGGGGGIGRAIALAFAAEGADVAIADIVAERAEEAAERVREFGRRALACTVDVSDTAQIEALVAQVEQEFGRIDILVNNAGGTNRKPFADTSERNWRRTIDLNLVALLAATSAVIPIMIRGGRGGSILNVSSIEGARAAPNFAVYAACKAGMNNFTRTMAVELADHGIRVNAIAPDYAVTPGTSGNIAGPVDEAAWLQPSPAQAAATRRRIPLGRAGRAEECAQAALFLASDLAGYITGTILPVDGGTWASSGWVRDSEGKWVLAEVHRALPG